MTARPTPHLHLALAARGRGAILILVLVILSGLSLLALGVSYRSRVQLSLARYEFERAYARQLAEAGLVIAMDRLGQEKALVTALNQPWHAAILPEGASGLPVTSMRYGSSQTVEVTCTDEEGLLNLNKAEPGMAQKLPIPPAVLAALADWTSPGETPSRDGAKSVYYLSLPSPYRSKNMPVEDLNELLLLRGVTTALFYGARTPASPGGYPPGGSTPGLRDLLTVYGDGKINLNTAPMEVLASIPGLSDRAVRQIVHVRNGPDGIAGNRDDHLFTDVNDAYTACQLDDIELQMLDRYCKVRSEYFRIVSRVTIDNGRMPCAVELVVRRLGATVIPLQRQEIVCP